MASIRDLVGAIRQREGVEAAVVLGRDGLLIDSQTVPGLDAEDIAARIPAIIGPADELGAAAARGPLTTAVLEHRDALAIVSVLSADALLLVLVRAGANVGQLLYELRRNREQIASLV
jgi:predicted regulator of Ras-like GTPase activity (Roadblock/LC7/MglB family)